MQLFRITYCQPFVESSRNECKRICEEFVHNVHEHFPELKKKVKIHLILHLTENMLDFGPTSAFNTERCIIFLVLHMWLICMLEFTQV